MPYLWTRVEILWGPRCNFEAIFREISKTLKMVKNLWNISHFFGLNFKYFWFSMGQWLRGFEVTEFKSVIKIEVVRFSTWDDFDPKLGPNLRMIAHTSSPMTATSLSSNFTWEEAISKKILKMVKNSKPVTTNTLVTVRFVTCGRQWK